TLENYNTYYGTYIRTTDNGRTWKWHQYESFGVTSGFIFVSSDKGLSVVQPRLGYDSWDAKMYTTDGNGSEWTVADIVNQEDEDWDWDWDWTYSLQSPVTGSAWFISDSLVMVSTNSGDTWRSIGINSVPLGADTIPYPKAGEAMQRLHVLDPQHLYAVYSIQFVLNPTDTNLYLPSSPSDIYSSSDGGENWQLLMRRWDE